MNDTYGLTSERPLAIFDRDTQSWKMYGVISLWGDSPLLDNLPPSGMTRNGALFQQPAWVPITDATASSSWPTPTTMDKLPPKSEQALEREATVNRKGRTRPGNLRDAVANMDRWPTPTVDDSKNVNPKDNRIKGLVAAVNEREKWATPRAAMKETRNHTVWERSSDKPQNLENQVASVEPSAVGGKLNPEWVGWLMGFPPGWTDLQD